MEVTRIDGEGSAGIAELSGRIPARKPHVRGFFLDDEGNVWIMPTPTGGTDAGSTASGTVRPVTLVPSAASGPPPEGPP